MVDPACPHCKRPDGYYEKRICAHEQSWDFDGEPFNCEVTFVRGGKLKYCICCHREITAYVSALKNNNSI